MQSDLNDCFAKIKIYLEQGSLVCFIGTTCQVYGLMTYLKKEVQKFANNRLGMSRNTIAKTLGKVFKRTKK